MSVKIFPIGMYIIMIIAESNVNIDRLGWKILNKLGRQQLTKLGMFQF